MDEVAAPKTEESQSWHQFLEDLDVRVVGTLSKGSGARLTLAVISSSGSHLYAFLREDDLGELKESARIDDA